MENNKLYKIVQVALVCILIATCTFIVIRSNAKHKEEVESLNKQIKLFETALEISHQKYDVIKEQSRIENERLQKGLDSLLVISIEKKSINVKEAMEWLDIYGSH